MPRRPGGLDPSEVGEALEVFNAARSPEELEAALDRVPALRTPMLHAILRQEYLRLSNARSPRLDGFASRYRDLFLLLHERWHREIVEGVRAGYRASASPRDATRVPPGPFLPPYWAALRDSLGDLLPEDPGPAFDPAHDAEGLREELRRLLGGEPALPVYEPTAGVSWNAVVVGCAACGRTRLDVRAFGVDLVLAPELAGPLREGRLNNTVCPACGEACACPIRVWVMDQPGPGDPLAALSCAWRLAPRVFCYQPPPGTTRVEDRDRILEVRFGWLLRGQRWPDPPGQPAPEGAVQTTMSVAYSLDELIGCLDRVTGDSGMPLAMETLIRELTRKVDSGVLPLHQAMDAALEHATLVGRDWPPLWPGIAREWAGPPLAHLFQSLVAEGVLRARSQSPDRRAWFAATTASSLIAMGESALAEAALRRADDCVAQALPGRARELARLAVADVHADLLESLGRYEEAMVIRRELSELPQLRRDDLNARSAAIAAVSHRALERYHQGRFADALDAFGRCVADWQALLDEAASGGAAPSDDVEARAVRHGLSGDLANLGSVLMALADDFAVTQAGGAPDHAALARAEAALPILERTYGEEIDRARLLAEAESLLRRALALSTAAGGWEFAGVQAQRLCVLRRDAGDLPGAEEFAELTVRYAARSGDHVRAWTALAFLAERDLERDNGPRALDHLEACVRDRIRLQVGLGHHAELLRATDAIAQAAFRAVAVGGDALRAIMIVESMRAAHTAASLAVGTPYQLGDGTVPEPVGRVLAERERLRLHLAWNPDDADAQARLNDAEAELDRTRTEAALRDPRFGRWVDATDVDLATPDSMVRRLAALGPNSLWFGALATRDTVWTWIAGADGTAAVAPRPRPERWRADPASDDGAGPELPLAELASALLTPHTRRLWALSAADTLVVSVDGSLRNVPFAALPWAGKRLCHYAEIVTVQGFGMFEAALGRPRLQLGSFALIGAPKRADLDPLPGADQELTAIAGLLAAAGHEVHVAKGAAATTKALVDAAPLHDVLHIACHVAVDGPRQAAQLKLSPDVTRSDSGDVSEDRIATGVTLRRGALVDVAGCSTGRTKDTGGPLLGGLAPALLLAGAGCVIASLWPIADAPAARFQLELYRHLVSGTRPAAALAAAQRGCARGDLGDDMRSPAIWAAYVAFGGP